MLYRSVLIYVGLLGISACQKAGTSVVRSSTTTTCDLSDDSCVSSSAAKATADDNFVVSGPTTGQANAALTTSWTPVEGAKEYIVALSNNEDCTDIVESVSGIKETTYDMKPKDSGSFYICTFALTKSGLVKSGSGGKKIEVLPSTSSTSPTSSSTTPAQPTAPSTSSTFSQNNVTFTWSTTTNAATYYIEIGTTSGGSDVYSGNVGSVLTYTVSATDGQSYYARIKAVSSDGTESEFSNSSSSITSDQQAPTAASSLRIAADSSSGASATKDNDSTVYAIWTASTDAASGMATTNTYSVSWYSQASCAGAETTSTTTDTYKEITGLSGGTTYSFRVTSYDAVGNTAASSCSSSIEIDLTAPPALQASSGSTGSTGSNVDLSIDFPADTSDYSQILIYRSSASSSTGVSAPSCGSGTLVSTITDFSTDPLTVNDSTGSFGKYFSYRVCIYDAAGNVTSSDTIIDSQSRSLSTTRQYQASMITGSANSGDISSNSTSTWTDISGNTNGTLNNFALPSDANSGWDGDGTGSDPYRLKFDGTNDYVSVASTSITAVTMWFKADTIDTNVRYLLYEMQGCCVTPIGFFVSNDYLTIGSRSSDYLSHGIEANEWYQLAFTYDGSHIHAYVNTNYLGSLAASNPAGWSSTMYLGSRTGSADFFDGSIADVRIYSENLSGDTIRALYGETAPSYKNGGSMTIEALDPAIGSTSGSTNVYITGKNLTSVNSVTFGGTAASSITVLSDHLVRAVTPSASSFGYQDVVISDGSNTTTLTDGFKYTTTPMDNLILLLDAKNTDKLATAGDSSNSKSYWNSLSNGIGVGMRNFASPSNTNSGWNGTGSAASPYQLKFDGTNDHTLMDLPFSSLSVWFNADTVDSTLRYLFYQLGTCCITPNTASLRNGAVQFATYGSSYFYDAIESGEWNHLVLSNDGTNTYGYLNGHSMGSTAGGNPYRASYFYLGSNESPASYFDGSIMEFRAYTDSISSSEVQSIYAEGVDKLTSSSTFSVSSISSGVGALAGGNSVTIFGNNLTGVDAVTFGGTAASAFTVVSDHHITATVPAGSAGFADVVVSKGATDVTVSNGYRYTATQLTNIQTLLDATNIDRNGSSGDGTSSSKWRSNGDGFGYPLNGFAQPTDGSSGWDGDGTTGDPYRLNFDGTDDYLSGYARFKAISVWFNADTIDATNRYIFYQMDTCCTAANAAYLSSGTIYASTRSSTVISAAITSGGWHHLVITNDGSDTRAYLNNTLIGTETGTTSPEVASTATFYIGDNAASSGAFDGSISEFRVYTDNLTSTEVGKLYNETKGRFGL